MVALKVLCGDAFWFCFFLVVVGVRLRVVWECFFGGAGQWEGREIALYLKGILDP
jgi:hypothetical protein